MTPRHLFGALVVLALGAGAWAFLTTRPIAPGFVITVAVAVLVIIPWLQSPRDPFARVTAENHRAALAAVAQLMDWEPAEGTAEALRLRELAGRIERYERNLPHDGDILP